MSLLLAHVILAAFSIISATCALVSPGKSKILVTIGSSACTLLSGVLLIIYTPTTLLRSCLSGILFLLFVAGMTYAAQRRLLKSATKPVS